MCCRLTSARRRARAMCRARPSTPSRSSRSPASRRAGKPCLSARRKRVGSGWLLSAAAPAASNWPSRRSIASSVSRTAPEVTLVTRGLLPSHNAATQRRFGIIFAERGIRLVTHNPIERVEPGRLIAADGSRSSRRGALGYRGGRGAVARRDRPALDARGFVVIDERLRSADDAAIFAAATSRRCRPTRARRPGLCRRAGPPLADNLRRALAGRRLRRAVPQKRALALIGTGDGHAVAFARAARSPRRAVVAFEELDRSAVDAALHRTAGDGCRKPARMAKMPCAAAVAPPRCRPRCWAGSSPASMPLRAIAWRSGSAARTTPRSCRFPARRPVADRRFLPRDGLRPLPLRPHRGDPCAGDIYAMGGLPETALAIATLPPRARRSSKRISSTC